MWCSSSRGRVVAALIAIVLATASAPTLMFAAEPSAADKSTARDAFVAGQELRDKKDHKGALEKFKVAYALVPSPITALEVGRSLIDLGLLVEGSEKLIEAATMPPKPTESADGKKARVEARKRADEVATRIPTLRIRLDGVTADAAVVVTVDGREVPRDALAAPLKLNPGAHRITAKRVGAAERVETVTLKEGEARELVVTLPAPSAATAAPASNENGNPTKPDAVVRDGERRPPSVRADDPRGLSSWTYVGFGIAGVGIVVGTVTGVAALSKSSTLEGECYANRACPPPAWGDVDSYGRLRAVSITSFVVAGVGVGVGIAGLLSGGSSEPAKSGAHVSPWIGLGSIGLRGAF